MDKNNTVVGFRMHFVKDGKESKEVVVPASPELAEQYDMVEDIVDEMTDEEMLQAAEDMSGVTEAMLGVPSDTPTATEKKGKNPWAK
jgi:hypothetical protein